MEGFVDELRKSVEQGLPFSVANVVNRIEDNFQKGLISENLYEQSFDVLEKAKYIKRTSSSGNYQYFYGDEKDSVQPTQKG